MKSKRFNICFINSENTIVKTIPNLTKQKVEKYLSVLMCENHLRIEVMECE